MLLERKSLRWTLIPLFTLAVAIPSGIAFANPLVPTAMVALDSRAGRSTRVLHLSEPIVVEKVEKRKKSFSLVKYQTPIQIQGRDMKFKFRAPGRKRSLVHFEVKF